MRIRTVLSVVGLVIFVMGATMLFSMAVAFAHGGEDAFHILFSSLLSMAAGAVLYWQGRAEHRGYLSLKDGFGIVSFSWIAASLFGALPFIVTGAIPEFHYAFFESASGLTTTGSTILNDIETVSKGVLFWRSFLHWLGGMGIIVLSVAILPFLGLGGMQLYKAESPGPTKDKLQPRIQETAKALWMVYVLVSVLCFVLLMVADMNWFDAACHTFGTVGTGGFSTYNASVAHFNSPMIEYIIIIFMFICGISFALHYRAISGSIGEYFRTGELKFYLLLVVISTTAIYLSRYDQQLPMEQKLRETLFQVVSIITTTGYGTADFELWAPVAQLILVGLMFVGGCAGSTGGGLKVVRILLLLKHLRTLLRQQLHPSGVFVIKLDGARVERSVVQNIIGLFLMFLFILSMVSLFLAASGVDIVTAVTATVSCLSNIGPGLSEVGPTDNFSGIPPQGIWMLSLCMIMGRLEIFSLLIIILPETWRR